MAKDTEAVILAPNELGFENVYLAGVGSAIPPHTINNEELCELFNIPRERGLRYEHLLGVQSRASCCDYRNGRVQTVRGDELAADAARAALAEADLEPNAIDVVISTSSFFDYIAPPISALVLRRLGIKSAQTFDLIGGCAEFLHGVHLARVLIASRQARNVLITASEVISAWWQQARFPLEYFIFGDGGGAFVLRSDTGSHRLIGSSICTEPMIDGVPADLITVPIIGGKTVPPLIDTVEKVDPICAAQSDIHPTLRLLHNARLVGLAAPRSMLKATMEMMARHGIDPDQAFLVPHQASRNVLEAMVETRIPRNQIGISLTQRGNLSTCSIPVTWADHREKVNRQPFVLATSVGVGMSYGALAFERV